MGVYGLKGGVFFFEGGECDDGIYSYGFTYLYVIYVDSCNIVTILVVCISLKGMEVKYKTCTSVGLVFLII